MGSWSWLRSQALWRDAGGELLQALPLGPSLGQQLAPVVRRMAVFQHLAKHPVGIVAAFVGAPGILIVDPREHDQFAGRVVAEEEPVLLDAQGTGGGQRQSIRE